MTDASYIRVSSDIQDASRQIQSITKWAAQNGWTIAQSFEDSEGRNSRDLAFKRKAFQRLLGAVKAGEVKRVIVDSQDRFGTRDAYQLGEFLTIFRDHGCQLWSVAQGHLTKDDDATTLTNVIGALTSTREQREKAHRNVGGKVDKAKLGEYQGGYPPYGLDVVCFNNEGVEQWRVYFVGHYKRFKIYPDGNREQFDGKNNFPSKNATDVLRYRPTIDEARLKAVKNVFEWYANEAVSPGQIADRLNALGLSTTVGSDFHKVIIRQMLINPVYIGLPAWNKRGGSRFKEYIGGEIKDVSNKIAGRKRATTDYVQPCRVEFTPIIDQDTWDAVQLKVNGSKQKTKRAPQVAELWLRGFLVCGKCGKPMRACNPQPRMEYGSYFCGTYGTYGKANKTGCRCHRVKHSLVEAMVEKYLSETGQELEDLATADVFDAAFDQWAAAISKQNAAWTAMNAVARPPETLAEVFDVRQRYTPKDCPAVVEAIEAKEAELDDMLAGFVRLSPALQDRANRKMEALSAEIEGLRSQLADLSIGYDAILSEVDARGAAVRFAASLSEQTGPRKAEALAKVVDSIVCHFRYEGVKSILDSIEIHAANTALLADSSPSRITEAGGFIRFADLIGNLGGERSVSIGQIQ